MSLLKDTLDTLKLTFCVAAGITTAAYLWYGFSLYAVDRQHTQLGNPIDVSDHPVFGPIFTPFDYNPK